ncbi:hypothetical protein CHS0354_015380 [Potamilus streckersoni]|uniref:Uncharacterized protein n=1 Tax=Potamilus streckersoni TaxID=2493646 RepID=A0AAE0VNH4_9BIVA|nr:hypothetical protein CHS0354_015380 [Potamilus streckersoni]
MSSSCCSANQSVTRNQSLHQAITYACKANLGMQRCNGIHLANPSILQHVPTRQLLNKLFNQKPDQVRERLSIQSIAEPNIQQLLALKIGKTRKELRYLPNHECISCLRSLQLIVWVLLTSEFPDMSAANQNCTVKASVGLENKYEYPAFHLLPESFCLLPQSMKVKEISDCLTNKIWDPDNYKALES